MGRVGQCMLIHYQNCLCCWQYWKWSLDRIGCMRLAQGGWCTHDSPLHVEDRRGTPRPLTGPPDAISQFRCDLNSLVSSVQTQLFGQSYWSSLMWRWVGVYSFGSVRLRTTWTMTWTIPHTNHKAVSAFVLSYSSIQTCHYDTETRYTIIIDISTDMEQLLMKLLI